MKLRSWLLFSLLVVSAHSISAQQPTPQQSQANYDATSGTAYDIARIAQGVQAMNKTLKDFVDKFAKVDGVTLSEKQQKLVMGMELLIRAEQRVATLQKFQTDLVEKNGELRTRFVQVENELSPQGLDRSIAFEGSTRAPEIKENRRQALLAERASLQTVLQQLQSQLQTISGDVREAQELVYRLRRAFLPQVERELSDQ